MNAAFRSRKDPHQFDHLNVTAIGGGHGLGRVMSTLSFMRKRLVGIVATTDNGGSTGQLRNAHQCIAWGDIRNCMSQLANQPLAAEVLNFRFDEESSLSGHSMGNLLLYTLDALSARPVDGIQLLSRLLKVQNRILPMAESPTDLVAVLENDMQCFGEIRVDELNQMPKQMALSPQVTATPEAIRHIQSSDLIILGPGSFLTSILPPLLVGDIAHAIANSSAKVVFIDNLTQEPSPAGYLSLSERLAWLEKQLEFQPVDLVISPHSDAKVTVPMIHNVIADARVAHRHQQDSLLQALNHAVTTLWPERAAAASTDVL
ncbi:uridine diphosphate-N-acetylglucosamine-binding protein YvcK [Aliidiomarina halalkaliphila]|uniref:Putative gluconeogenesis factor n=1 Tax=Aliidiomarina halalkaliphila TaxID=2593535 RepID=A0A552X450_9GAMM|nr:uridine diphosphate-N-acetylglucosamine-binding protein YvcK [Aliidiomarina halalkaliphila]TRW49679.1 uridine diphosphate-N-acetylglucosamine-binding protein YvcK [Aliidiomarina halalkaliphila]